MPLVALSPQDTAETILSDEALATLYDWSGSRRVALNIVTTLNGSLTDRKGISDGLSSPDDRHILALIRRFADVIVVGAATARVEQYTSPRDARLAIVTATGDLTGLALTDWANTVVIAPRGVPVETGASASIVLRVDATPGAVDANAIIQSLQREGYERILCEGGGRIATAFATSGHLTDLFLSMSPRILTQGIGWLGHPGTDTTEQKLRLRHIIRDGDTDALYTRWGPAPAQP